MIISVSAKQFVLKIMLNLSPMKFKRVLVGPARYSPVITKMLNPISLFLQKLLAGEFFLFQLWSVRGRFLAYLNPEIMEAHLAAIRWLVMWLGKISEWVRKKDWPKNQPD